MAEPNHTAATIRSGAFEVDLRTGELRKSGVRIRLQEQPFKILASLLERPGELVTREELRRRIWPEEEFGDFDHAVNLAVAKLRTALGDSAEQPRFVETLPRRGYRFIGKITTPAPIPAEAEPNRSTRFRHPSPGMMLGLLTSLVCALAVVFAYRGSRPLSSPPTLSALPFTTLPGLETSPAFSPDGSRIAFAWNGGPSAGAKGFDLYVKAIGSETLLRLTQHPSKWISSAWSPDGTQIAFHRMAGADTGLYLVPALGGPERKLRSTRLPYSVAAPISWSPDGKWIAFSDPLPAEPKDRIHLLAVDTLEIREFPHNPKCLHEALATFSHKGDELAYLCVHSTSEFEVYTVPPFGGTPKLISASPTFILGLAWSGDDRRLVLSQASDSGFELYDVSLADGSSRRLDFAENAGWPAVSANGDKLAYSAEGDRTSVWRMDLLHPESPAIELFPSTQSQQDAQYSPDGQHIAFWSFRAGSGDIWMSDADGNNLVQLSKPINNAGCPRWSPDGKKIVFDSRRSKNFEIYVVDISERVPKKLATNIPNISGPSWSRDGKWIYFRSYEALGHKIYRCPAIGGNAVALGGQPDGTSPQESFDGKALYFATRLSNTGLSVISLNGAFPESAVEGFPATQCNLWTMVPGGIYFVPADEPRSLRYFDFSKMQIRHAVEIPQHFGAGLSISPDGRWLLFSQVVEDNSNIMLVDHFN